MLQDVVEISAECRHCSVAVVLSFHPWAGTGPATAASWACPSCGAINTLQVIGRVGAALRVTDPSDAGA